MKAPSRNEVIERFQQLLQEATSREQVATWAQKWVIADNPTDMEKDVWEALQFLTCVDLISTDRPYLYSAQDLRERTTLSYWFPKIEAPGIPVPKTTIISYAAAGAGGGGAVINSDYAGDEKSVSFP